MRNAQIPASSPIDQVTLEHLWNTANELKAIAPTVSQRLAATLVTSVPEDGMSSFAKRKHCNKCAALVNTARVRVRKVVKKARRRSEAFRNVVITTCESCGARNVDKGVGRNYRPKADEAEVNAFRKRVLKKVKDKNNEAGKDGDADRSVEGAAQCTNASSASNVSIKKKRKRRKSKDSSNSSRTAGSKSGLAASFLFDPL